MSSSPASASLALMRRTLVSVSIAVAALLGFGSLVLRPVPPAGMISAQLFVVAQLFWAIGLIGLAHIATRRSPVLAVAGGVLAGLGAFAHTVGGGAMLVQQSLAGTDPDAMLAALAATQSGGFAPYLLLGLAGNVVGIILIAVAIIRARAASLWMPIALLVWIAVEFIVTGFVEWGSYLSLVIGTIAFAGLAVALWRSDLSAWRTAAEASAANAPAAVASTRAS